MKHWFKFIGWAKISAVAAFVSTIIGVAFQKGMLEKMGFGNMSGNYQIEEIISSAIHVYLMIGNSITELSTWKMLLTNFVPCLMKLNCVAFANALTMELFH